MKRFLSLLTVFMLALALAVPVGAVEYDTMFYNGQEFPNIDVFWTDDDKKIYPHAVIYSSTKSIHPYEFAMTKEPPVYRSGYNGGLLMMGGYKSYHYDNGEWVYTESYDDTILSMKSTSIWSSSNIYYENSTEVYALGSSPVAPVCDGSACPATDVNFDDICDDCGAPLAYNLRVTPNEYSIVVKHADGTTLRFSFTETLAGTDFNAVYGDNRITVTFNNPVNHNQYKLVDGEWTDYASYPNTYDYHSINLPSDASILSSDLNIYDENGDLFFQNPLWMTVGTVTQGEVTGMSQTVAGVMKILTVCGVGCLALLTVLKLFGKRSLLFRG